jgi:hypothetical protein
VDTLRRMRALPSRLFGIVFVLGLGGLLTGCPKPQGEAPDAAVPLDDLEPARFTVGAFEDCTPTGAGYSDARCAAGHRCAVVQLTGVGDSPSWLTQCVPLFAAPLKEGEACEFVEASPAGGLKKLYDRCADGTSCVPGADGSLKCRRTCALRVRGECRKGELCALPTQVSGVGFCAKPDACTAVPPPRGCPRGADGKETGCYVLGDDKGTAAFCWPQQPWGDSTGAIDSACERSWHCQSGHSCAAKSAGKEPTCRQLCPLPIIPDGGVADLGDIPCSGDLGTCRPISGIDGVGRCL